MTREKKLAWLREIGEPQIAPLESPYMTFALDRYKTGILWEVFEEVSKNDHYFEDIIGVIDREDTWTIVVDMAMVRTLKGNIVIFQPRGKDSQIKLSLLQLKKLMFGRGVAKISWSGKTAPVKINMPEASALLAPMI